MEGALAAVEPFDGHPFVLSRRLTALQQTIDVYAEVSCGNRSKPITLYGCKRPHALKAAAFN